jgi:hypothetical protein
MVARRRGGGGGLGGSAAVGRRRTPIPLPAAPVPWRCSARVQRPGRRGELCRRRPLPPRASAPLLPRSRGRSRRQGRAASPGCCARVGGGAAQPCPPCFRTATTKLPGLPPLPLPLQQRAELPRSGCA